MKRILLALVLLFFLVPVAECSVSSVDISPLNPEQGDRLSIAIQADPGESVDVSLSYSGDVPVSGGKYLIELSDVEIPSSSNRVSASVDGVENLKLAVKLPLLGWITITKPASGGSASFGQSNIPAGIYDIQVKGDALDGVSGVELSFTASITLTMDQGGSYMYSYDTGSIPPGKIKVDVDGEKQTITLSSSSGGGVVGGGVDPPVADFTVNGERLSGEVLYFDASSSKATVGIISEYSWSFGDGETGIGEYISHTFNEPGEYSIKLTVKNSYNLKDTKTLTILIEDLPNESPQISGGTTRGCLTGQTLFFNSNGYDPDGAITQYLWSFGDGSTGTGKNVQHTWVNPGVYTVNHTVVDDRGAASSAYYIVKVEEPQVGILNELEVIVETTLFQYFGDLGASITVSGNNTLLYLLEYDGNPGNGSLPNGQIGGVLDLVVSNPDSVNWPIYFEMDYDRSLVDNVTETSLGLYYYQDGGWRRCLRTGVDSDNGVVWANITRDELAGSPLTVGVIEPLPYYVHTGFRVLDSYVEEGSLITITYNASNSGEASGNLVSLIYLDEQPFVSKTVHLSPGEVKTMMVSFESPSRGVHQLRLGDQLEIVTVTPPTMADISCAIASNSTQLMPGDKLELLLTAFNTGNRTAEDFGCSLTIGGLKLSSSRIEALEPNATFTWSYIWIVGGEGEYPAILTVDTMNDVLEVDEENNSCLVVLVSEKRFTVALFIGLLILLGAGAVYLWRERWFVKPEPVEDENLDIYFGFRYFFIFL